MLDIKLIRKERARIEALIKTKEPKLDLGEVVALDEKLCQLKTEEEGLRAKRNDLSKEIGKQMKEGKSSEAEMAEVKRIGDEIARLDQTMREVEKSLEMALAAIPNLPDTSVKVSQNPRDNVVIKISGDKPTFDFAPKHHLELGEMHHLFDFERAAKCSGSGWPAYVGMGARLEWALINYMLDIQMLNGFTFWMPPLLVRREMMFGTGQIPKFEGQFYEVSDPEHPLYLLPTAEVALAGLHYDEILDEEKLPLKYVAYTPCFRREAGAAGEKERGLIRMHQFNKVEMFAFTTPEESEKMMQEMLKVAEEILQGLNMHYRFTELVTGDMSFSAAKTVDVEVWLPGQGRYYEVSSISNCTDYQARRSHIRYKKKAGGKPELIHTLNGSGLATSRLLVALLENNQTREGAIMLPPLLQEMLGVKMLEPKGR